MNLGVSRRKLDEVLGEEASGCVNGGGTGPERNEGVKIERP
jgi:hypothetical protein